MQIKHPIVVNNLYSAYNEKTTAAVVAINNFNYSFEHNKIYCIIGESGSGKSTLINYFNGLFKPTYGSLAINGIALHGKYKLNKIFLNKYQIQNTSEFHKWNLSFKFDKQKKYYLVQVPHDARDQEVKLTLRSYNPDNKSLYMKLNRLKLNLFKISNLIKNQFYIIESEHSLDDIPNVANTKDFKSVDISCRNLEALHTKKIKNFKLIRKNVGMVYQFPEYQLFKNTVLDDVMFGPRNLGSSKLEAKQKAMVSLKQLGIKEQFYNNSPFGLSGGQKRRVAIAGILAIGGDVLIFDEPTAGLDPKGEEEMVQIMLHAKQSHKTVFVVTHSMNEVLKIADEILVLHDGELLKSGKPYEVFNDHEIMQKTSIEVPYIIHLVNKLVQKDAHFSILKEWQPRTIEELGAQIIKLKGVKHATNI